MQLLHNKMGYYGAENRKWVGAGSDKGTKGTGVPRDDLNKGDPPLLLFALALFFQKFKLK